MISLQGVSPFNDTKVPREPAFWEDSSITLVEIPCPRVQLLQGMEDATFFDATRNELRAELPGPGVSSTIGGWRYLWIGAAEWLMLPTGAGDVDEDIRRLTVAIDPQLARLSAIGDSKVYIGVGGKVVADLLAQGCSIDLHPSAFQVGASASTRFAQLPIIMVRTESQTFELFVDRSYSPYLCEWLVKASTDVSSGATDSAPGGQS